MLGEQIGEDKGNVTARRVVPGQNGSPRVETTFESTGRLLGVNERGVATYWSEIRPDGNLYGEGQGVVMGEGGAMANWKGSGIGVLQADGSVKFRGAIYYESASTKWTRLNRVAIAYEHDVAADGSTHSKLWEWT